MSAMPIHARASFLTLPSELRNQIYMLVFDSVRGLPPPDVPDKPNALALSLQLQSHSNHNKKRTDRSSYPHQLQVLATCKQIYYEAHLLAWTLTSFHLSGDITYPELFDLRSRTLSAAKLGAVRHLTLTARTSHLRALNEAWMGLPFGHASLTLETLVIIPKRPEVYNSAYAELTDLSQSHTLAYVFCETLKTLRNVKCLELRNEGCFNEVVWKLFYRSLLYRLWRWAGGRCGIRFECGEEVTGEDGDKQWFRAYLKGGESQYEVGQEVARLMGWTEEPMDSDMAGVLP